MNINKQISKQFLKDALRNPLSVFRYSFFRYILIGVLTVLVAFGIFNFLILTLEIHGGVANFISTLSSLIFNFSMSYAWTFKVKGKQKVQSLLRYTALALFNLSFETISMFAFIEIAEKTLILSMLTNNTVTRMVNFTLGELTFFQGTPEGLLEAVLRNILKVIALLMIISWNFVLYKKWVFKSLDPKGLKN